MGRDGPGPEEDFAARGAGSCPGRGGRGFLLGQPQGNEFVNVQVTASPASRSIVAVAVPVLPELPSSGSMHTMLPRFHRRGIVSVMVYVPGRTSEKTWVSGVADGGGRITVSSSSRAKEEGDRPPVVEK